MREPLMRDAWRCGRAGSVARGRHPGAFESIGASTSRVTLDASTGVVVYHRLATEIDQIGVRYGCGAYHCIRRSNATRSRIHARTGSRTGGCVRCIRIGGTDIGCIHRY